ncbi:MAG: elongation factor Tu [Methanomicrobiaceae archaeon]|nr:elongation factor Tu [Methanomicrobiaceae archaeon]MDD5419509.1 EF-Tu/IF-2/RF-3 family GTPase [Methanomicrobiaceae archaeon]
MANLNVAVLAPAGYARDLGKKGTTSDITFYNQKRGEDTVTFIEPTRYPDRLAPLFYAASMAHEALVVIDAITPAFGEWVLMLQALDIGSGAIILRNYLTPDRLRPYVRGTVLERYEYLEEDFIALRERYLCRAGEISGNQPDHCRENRGTVSIDHHFNVKGIGTVILGGVERGVIRKHDAVKVYPGEAAVQIRSIQKHDDDAGWAAEGDRVGLALKNIDADSLDRGFVLSNDESIRSRISLEAEAELVAYWPAPLEEGMVLHVGHWMQFVPARVVSAKSNGNWRKPVLGLALEKDLVHLPGERAVLHYLDGGKLRIAGTVALP